MSAYGHDRPLPQIAVRVEDREAGRVLVVCDVDPRPHPRTCPKVNGRCPACRRGPWHWSCSGASWSPRGRARHHPRRHGGGHRGRRLRQGSAGHRGMDWRNRVIFGLVLIGLPAVLFGKADLDAKRRPDA